MWSILVNVPCELVYSVVVEWIILLYFHAVLDLSLKNLFKLCYLL